MRKPLFHFVLVVTLLAGCRQGEDLERLKIINESLEQANTVIQNDNKLLGEALTVRVRTPRTIYYGKIWEPRGNRIIRDADSIVAMIENLKANLLKHKEGPSFVKQLYVPRRRWRKACSKTGGL